MARRNTSSYSGYNRRRESSRRSDQALTIDQGTRPQIGHLSDHPAFDRLGQPAFSNPTTDLRQRAWPILHQEDFATGSRKDGWRVHRLSVRHVLVAKLVKSFSVFDTEPAVESLDDFRYQSALLSRKTAGAKPRWLEEGSEPNQRNHGPRQGWAWQAIPVHQSPGRLPSGEMPLEPTPRQSLEHARSAVA